MQSRGIVVRLLRAGRIVAVAFVAAIPLASLITLTVLFPHLKPIFEVIWLPGWVVGSLLYLALALPLTYIIFGEPLGMFHGIGGLAPIISWLGWFGILLFVGFVRERFRPRRG